MSDDDYMVDPLSDAEVRLRARQLRKFLDCDDAKRIDPLLLENVAEIWTVRGNKQFRMEVVADEELPEDSGLTSFDGARVVVKIPRRIRYGAFMGDGYARYTIGHEMGHATLHLAKLAAGAKMPRRRVGNTRPSWIPSFKSAEHQAMVFGSAFLINDRLARNLSSPEEISIQAGVSLAAARIFFEQVQLEMVRPNSIERVETIVKEIKNVLAEKLAVPLPSYLTEVCSCCGQQKIFPVGHRFMCQACDTVYDRFQDGDSVQ